MERLFNVLLVLLVAIGLLGVFAMMEWIAGALEGETQSTMTYTADDEIGWLPSPGSYVHITDEFESSIVINQQSMNDADDFQAADLTLDDRILVVGDSHTFAIGVSTEETWPALLEGALFPEGTGRVYNAAVVGYNLGQYLQRFQQLEPRLHPTALLVGFSFATDLYDLIPPDRGGFVYGGNGAREYFDLDSDGRLIERVHLEGESVSTSESLTLRGYLQQFAIYRRIKRSEFAMWIAVNWKPQGKSLWPGLDTALKKEPDADDEYRWQLAEAILCRLGNNARTNNITAYLVGIPYLAQVYDEVWLGSFGSKPDIYNRWLASEKMKDVASRCGFYWIDTTTQFVAEAERNGWLHYPKDAHPTVAGHRLIAEVVSEALEDTQATQ